jgi:hypothetical protein
VVVIVVLRKAELVPLGKKQFCRQVLLPEKKNAMEVV